METLLNISYILLMKQFGTDLLNMDTRVDRQRKKEKWLLLNNFFVLESTLLIFINDEKCGGFACC